MVSFSGALVCPDGDPAASEKVGSSKKLANSASMSNCCSNSESLGTSQAADASADNAGYVRGQRADMPLASVLVVSIALTFCGNNEIFKKKKNLKKKGRKTIKEKSPTTRNGCEKVGQCLCDYSDHLYNSLITVKECL